MEFPPQLRKSFVEGLYKLGEDLESDERHVVADARRKLARLRRSLRDERYAIQGYELLLPYNIPEKHERHCLLVAGLFALNPYAARKDEGRSRLCAALVDAGLEGAAEARVRQLIATAQSGDPGYRLRQAVQLIGRARPRIPLDFEQLLGDLIELDEDESSARKVLLRWARDFQQRVHTR